MPLVQYVILFYAVLTVVFCVSPLLDRAPLLTFVSVTISGAGGRGDEAGGPCAGTAENTAQALLLPTKLPQHIHFASGPQVPPYSRGSHLSCNLRVSRSAKAMAMSKAASSAS